MLSGHGKYTHLVQLHAAQGEPSDWVIMAADNKVLWWRTCPGRNDGQERVGMVPGEPVAALTSGRHWVSDNATIIRSLDA